ncbi:MAG: PaaI family thioesterase [Pseudomonadota bacterium]|uniref:PaaI family thioesterase n=1 Tax=Alcanivorax sp. TaxID=1872427 RepID=UPI00243F8901|nr:PaaI family thioesterase [Alcanivorax sp.]MED5238261.1 PaaI family thioesterase [Pseudomonadota bacterium]MEE3320107.1 PaaI family thioesterase [Pseudomonadota bacterium]
MKALKNLIEECRSGETDYQELVDRVPYARFLGIKVIAQGDELTFVLPKHDNVIGNPTLPALHGGAVAGFMEQAAIIFILLQMGEPRVPKTIDFTIDYLRAGHFRDTYAECSVTRLGRRIANVHISAWQKNRQEPITIARAHFLLSEDNA